MSPRYKVKVLRRKLSRGWGHSAVPSVRHIELAKCHVLLAVTEELAL